LKPCNAGVYGRGGACAWVKSPPKGLPFGGLFITVILLYLTFLNKRYLSNWKEASDG